MVVNPEVIERKYHLKIKKFTNKYLAYLYDSTMRNPVGHIIDVFDKVYSFDKKDIKKYGFSATTNYNYLLKKNVNDQENKLDLFYIGSYDERLKVLYKLSEKLDDFKLKYQFVIVGKKSRKKALFNSSKLHSKFYFTTKRIPHAEIPNYYEKSRVILDLVREHQSGLSFRIFEAMALQKKIITTNPFVKEYDFYNSNNILLLNKDLSNLEKSFFETDYQELSSEIYQKYTLENWVKNIFDL
ncbi:MAG: glycosyltransferase [Cloacibacterium sp.]|nr:glycosyltransferase [Cloacibacterium sp.]